MAEELTAAVTHACTVPASTLVNPVAFRCAMDDTVLWTAKDVAAFLQVSVRRARQMPGIPRVELPGRGERPIVRYVPAEVRAWAHARQLHSVIAVFRGSMETRGTTEDR